MKKTYPISQKSHSATCYHKHLRKFGKRLANKSTRRLTKLEDTPRQIILEFMKERIEVSIQMHKSFSLPVVGQPVLFKSVAMPEFSPFGADSEITVTEVLDRETHWLVKGFQIRRLRKHRGPKRRQSSKLLNLAEIDTST